MENRDVREWAKEVWKSLEGGQEGDHGGQGGGQGGMEGPGKSGLSSRRLGRGQGGQIGVQGGSPFECLRYSQLTAYRYNQLSFVFTKRSGTTSYLQK